ncbi:MAG: hypothetical protein LQ346_000458 [Caloplaca aetnensis]|nr:MAG: hypothetical protein LQ346_000458 [Caloplaca aetnensis]
MLVLLSIILLVVGNVLCVTSIESAMNASVSTNHTQPSSIAPRAPAVSPYGSAAICYSDKAKAPPISFAKYATEVVGFDDMLNDVSALCHKKCKHSKRSVMEKHKDYSVKHFGEPKVKTRVYCKVGYSEQVSGRPLDEAKCSDIFRSIITWCE